MVAVVKKEKASKHKQKRQAREMRDEGREREFT
jgi:hypothetical protein